MSLSRHQSGIDVVRRSVKITDLMPLGAVWTPDEGTQPFDPGLFED